jgi:hypothetical protein
VVLLAEKLQQIDVERKIRRSAAKSWISCCCLPWNMRASEMNKFMQKVA